MNTESKSTSIIFISFMISFIIKIPIYPLHVWLPYAHTEAPTYGSIILAGILLKLGSYGIIRFVITLLRESYMVYKPVIITLIIISIIYSSFVIIRILDLKKIIAYSSVIHMNTSLLGLIANNSGISGVLFVMVSHGIISSGLFYCVGILYTRTSTRVLKYYKGLTVTMPIFSIVFFILIMANAAVPGTAGFIGELICLKSLGSVYWMTTVGITGICIIMGAIYNIWLMTRLIFGESSISIVDVTRRETMVIITYIKIVIILGISPNIILEVFEPSIQC